MLPVVDELAYQLRLQRIQLELKTAFASAMLPLLQEDVRHRCFGCDLVDEDGDLYDHPSQLHHDVCLMMQPQEQVELCFDSLLDKVDYERVYALWMWQLDAMRPEPTFVEIGYFAFAQARQGRLFMEEYKEDVKALLLQAYATDDEL